MVGVRGLSSVGRALPLQGRSQGFESPRLHSSENARGPSWLAAGQSVSDALQITLDGLQIRLSLLECLRDLVGDRRAHGCRLVLRAVRDDGAGSDLGALIRIPYRRLLDKAR